MMNQMKRDAIVDFIRTYKSLPALWDTTHKHYSNRHFKAESYAMLIEKLQILEPDASRLSVITKINSLRSSFRKELRKVQRDIQSGAQRVHEPTLWYYDELLFLVNSEKPRTKLGTKYNSLQAKIETDLQEINFTFDNDNDNTQQQDNEDDPLSCPSPSSSASPPPVKKLKTFQTHHNRPEILVQRQPETTIARNNNSDDEFMIMARFYAEKIRKMSPMQVLFADRVINEVLLEGQIGNLTRWTGITLNTQPQTQIASYNTGQSSWIPAEDVIVENVEHNEPVE